MNNYVELIKNEDELITSMRLFLELSPNRPSSTGSYAGGPTGIDKKVHQLDKEYSELMDQYRRLKQMRKTPERDAEVDLCLKVRLTFKLQMSLVKCLS